MWKNIDVKYTIVSPNAELSSANKMASVGLGLAYDAMRRFAEPQHTK